MSRKLHERIAGREEGFTLIEILAVMIIIGILAKEMAHTSEVAMEALGSDNDGSYSTASPANLNSVDLSIPIAAGSPPKPYVSFTCTVPAGNDRGGCPTGGDWG